MPHTLQKMPHWIEPTDFVPVCSLKGVIEGDLSPCSQFDYCERPATIWLYCRDGIFGYCNTCYNWCYPCPEEWYRVLKISPDFQGVL